MRRPGTIPAMKSPATDTLVATTAYTIIAALGGMMGPMHDAAATMLAANPRG